MKSSKITKQKLEKFKKDICNAVDSWGKIPNKMKSLYLLRFKIEDVIIEYFY